LDSLDDERFQMVYVRDLKSLLKESESDHFWIAYFVIPEWVETSPAMKLIENDYRVGDPIIYNNFGDQMVLLPVWKK
jgi:hypothetical protein